VAASLQLVDDWMLFNQGLVMGVGRENTTQAEIGMARTNLDMTFRPGLIFPWIYGTVTVVLGNASALCHTFR
jgi:hypothetical protein